MLLKLLNFAAAGVGLVCFFVGAHLHGPAELKIREYLHPDFMSSNQQKAYVAALAYEKYIPMEVRRQYFIATMLMGISLVCMAVLMFQVNDVVVKVLTPLVGGVAFCGMIAETRRYLKSMRPL